jgi:parallel beta-helix repeat protein
VVRGSGAGTDVDDEDGIDQPKARTQCLISENTVSACASIGIALIGTEDICQVRDNSIIQCGDTGIMIERKGQPQVISNFVHECGKVGVHVKSGADPHIQKNEVHHNMLGIAVQGQGTSGTFEENDVFENSAGCAFIDRCEPIIRLNNIRLNGDYGISAHDGGQPWLEDNDVVFNRKHGIVLGDESNACVRRNRIHSNAGVGVEIKSLADPGTEVDENKIFGNVVSDIRQDPSSRIVLGINFTGNNPAAATYAALTVSRTLFVDPTSFQADPSKKGDSRLLTFDSIAACLEKAVSGDRVIIRHGIYRENFSLGDGVVVVGNTDCDGVIIHCTEPIQMLSSYGSPCRLGRQVA